jgi:hypothetical protein
MTIAFKPTATETTIEHNGSAIATLDSTGLTMASGKTISGSGVGKVLQVVQGLHTTQFTTTSGTYVDVTGFNATITPTSASSKILVMVTALSGHNAAAQAVGIRLLRDSTEITLLSSSGGYLAGATFLNEIGFGTNYLDSPATTSAVTYKIQMLSSVAGNTVYMSSGSTTQSTITLMEIAG